MTNTPEIRKVTRCRVCHANSFTPLFSLGLTPLANAFLSSRELDTPEKIYPLDLQMCNMCSLVMLTHVVNPKLLFANYLYVSSTSPVFVKHFEDFADTAITKFDLQPGDTVVDIGSNDGILLTPFQKKGFRVGGIEPAREIARAARKKGIPTIDKFISETVARQARKKFGPAKLVTMTNVFAHIDNLDEVLKSVSILLDSDGVGMIEAPYMTDFLETHSFDLIYHEHLSYWTLKSLETVLKRFDFSVVDAEHTNVHGGSIRLYFSKSPTRKKNTEEIREWKKKEREQNLSDPQTYRNYFKSILENRVLLLKLLSDIKMNGKNIAGFGAPAKSTTLMNFFGIRREFLDYIVDDSPLKQGRFTPGTHVPVVSSKHIETNRPDYILILAWNFANSIVVNYDAYRKSGGKFIIPVPAPQVV